MFHAADTTRVRRSPFFDATLAAGVASFTTYNRMLLPTGYGDADGEYWRLIDGVTMWDVAAQRQVELAGADAGKLAQILSPRNLSACAVGQGKYTALCNHAGVVINDPVVLKLADDRYWFSIADSNILFWARAIASERKLNVTVTEPDVSPLAVQGRHADEVIASMFGDDARAMKHFSFKRADLAGIPLTLARSGWSKQGGFEIYLMDGAHGVKLWNLVAEAGAPFGIKAGCPNAMERIEGGLLSWGGDTDDATNPFEVRLEKFVDLDVGDDVVGVKALRKIHARGPARHQLGLILDDDQPTTPHSVWYDITADGDKVGDMTCGIFSPRLKRNIGFALISRDLNAGDTVTVIKNKKDIPATLTELPFI